MKKFALAAIVALATIPAIFAEGNKEETPSTTVPAPEEAGQEGNKEASK